LVPKSRSSAAMADAAASGVSAGGEDARGEVRITWN
jgi:hypothetical protein